MTIPLTWVQAPERAPRPNTSLDVLPVHDVDNSHFVGFTYVADPCGFPGTVPRDCYIQLGPTATAVNEVQRATITGTPTGGTFILSYAGQPTTAIAYNAAAATVQTALEALDSVSPGDVVVGGGPGPGTPYTFTFGGALGGTDLPQMTATGSFTGGTAPAIAITTTTAGVSPKTFGSVGTEVVTQVFGAYQGIECSPTSRASTAASRSECWKTVSTASSTRSWSPRSRPRRWRPPPPPAPPSSRRSGSWSCSWPPRCPARATSS